MKKTGPVAGAGEIEAQDKIPGAISTRPSPQNQLRHKQHYLSVYDGRVCCGHIVGDGDRWEALSPTGETIGTFASRIDAADAIISEAS